MKNNIHKNDFDYFPNPYGENDEILKLLNDVSRILCGWFSQAESLSPLPIESSFITSFPEESSCSKETLLSEINDLIYSSYNPSHPGSLANLDPPPLILSIVGELISGALNNNLLAQELSPSISRLEKEICEWLSMKIGFSKQSGGIAASGGTLSNLNALVTARHIAGVNYDPNASFIISEDAHSSFKKFTRILGIKGENLIEIETDINGCMNVDSLIDKLAICKKNGKKVFAVIATFGTTIRGAIDPIDEISRICKTHNIWLHVDGSIGGVFAIFRNKIKGIYQLKDVNSVTINPQKILGITKTSSVLLINNINHLKETFKTGLPYIYTPENSFNLGEFGIQGTRSAEIIKLWLGLRYLGLAGIEDILNSSIEKRVIFENFLDINKFKITTGPLHIISFIPKGYGQEKLEKWTFDVQKYLKKNNFMISRPVHKRKYLLRVVFGNFNTKKTDIKKLANLINNQ